ncbi:MAG: rhomboid family intramembrane serine protease [Polyangiaceae bacterium]
MPAAIRCPWCGKLTSVDGSRCVECERWIPPEPLLDWLRTALEVELPVTKFFVLLNVLVFAGELASARAKALPLVTGVSISSLLRFGALTNGYDSSEPWRFVSASFVHVSILHIVMNMMGLVDFGRILEPALKSARFTIAYLMTGVIGFATSVWWSAGKPYVTAGASASVYGLVGLFLGALMMRKNPLWKDMLVRLVLWGVITAYAFNAQGLPVNNAAHIGGGLAGVLFGVVYSLETRPWRITPILNVLAALALIGTVVCLVLPMQSKAWPRAREEERWQQQLRDLDRLAPDSW